MCSINCNFSFEATFSQLREGAVPRAIKTIVSSRSSQVCDSSLIRSMQHDQISSIFNVTGIRFVDRHKYISLKPFLCWILCHFILHDRTGRDILSAFGSLLEVNKQIGFSVYSCHNICCSLIICLACYSPCCVEQTVNMAVCHISLMFNINSLPSRDHYIVNLDLRKYYCE